MNEKIPPGIIDTCGPARQAALPEILRAQADELRRRAFALEGLAYQLEPIRLTPEAESILRRSLMAAHLNS